MRRVPVSALVLGLMVSVLTACGGMKTSGQKEIATMSDQTQSQNRANIRLQLAVSYFEQRQLPVALDEVKLALQADPENAEAHGLRALIYNEMGETALAGESFARAIRLAPNSPDLANNYGWYLCQNGREIEGLKQFETAYKNRAYASPEKALNNAGLCTLRLKNLDKAEEYFRDAFKFDPANLATNTNLARLYYQRKDYERARFYMSRVIKSSKGEVILPPDVLWLALRLERKLGDSAEENVLATQLRRHHPNSAEFKAWQRGAFDE